MSNLVDNQSSEFQGLGPLKELTVLWLSAGLGCDGESVAITAATQPSIEDLVMCAIPGIPRVKFLNPFLAYDNGDDFIQHFHHAAEGLLTPFILVLEGSVPNEEIKDEGYWASNLMHKLDLHTQADLIRYALRRGIVPMEE